MTITKTLIQELKNSGCNRKSSREIIVSGVLGWKRKIPRGIQEGTPFYRSAGSSLAQRCKKKLTEKTSWDKNKKRRREDDADGTQNKKMREGAKPKPHTASGEQTGHYSGSPCEPTSKAASTEDHDQGKPVKAVMFVPYTVGSELARRMRDAETKIETMTEDSRKSRHQA